MNDSEAGRRISTRLRRAKKWRGPTHASYLRYYKEDVPYLLGLIKELSQKLAKKGP
jgi:hypothetical protein